MTSAPSPSAPGLHFRSLRLDGERSIAADLSNENCCGIYAYEFSDGTWYVGKSTDVRDRHQQHLHEYRHDNPPKQMVRMFFAEVPSGNPSLLDRLETDAIRWFADNQYNLTNIAKTSTPQGPGPAVITIDGRFGVEIPWLRTDRESPELDRSHARDLSECKTQSKFAKYKELCAHDGSNELMSLLRRIASEAIPSPASTAGKLWTATAMPDGRWRKPLCCLSVGNIELLVAFPRRGRIEGFINMKAKERTVDGTLHEVRFPAKLRKDGFRTNPGQYSSSEGVLSVDFFSLDELGRVLERDDVLDHVYSLAAEQMRRGSCMYARFTNEYLVERIMQSKL